MEVCYGGHLMKKYVNNTEMWNAVSMEIERYKTNEFKHIQQ